MATYLEILRRRKAAIENPFVPTPTDTGVFVGNQPYIAGTGQLRGVSPAPGAPVVNEAYSTSPYTGALTSPVLMGTPGNLQRRELRANPQAPVPATVPPAPASASAYRAFIDKNTKFADLPLLKRKSIEGLGSVEARARRAEKHDLAIERRLTREAAQAELKAKREAKAASEKQAQQAQIDVQAEKNKGLTTVAQEATNREKLKISAEKDINAATLLNDLAVADKKIEEAKLTGNSKKEIALLNDKYNLALGAFNNKLSALQGNPEAIQGLQTPTLDKNGNEVRGGISAPDADKIKNTIVFKRQQGNENTAQALESRLIQAGWSL